MGSLFLSFDLLRSLANSGPGFQGIATRLSCCSRRRHRKASNLDSCRMPFIGYPRMGAARQLINLLSCLSNMGILSTRPIANSCLPYMTHIASPPSLFVAPGGDLLRSQLSVLGRMPLFSENGLAGGQTVGIRQPSCCCNMGTLCLSSCYLLRRTIRALIHIATRLSADCRLSRLPGPSPHFLSDAIPEPGLNE